MDKIVIDGSFRSNNLVFDKDSYVVIKNDVETKDLIFNIINCKVTIIDMSNIPYKEYNFRDGSAVIVEVVNSEDERVLKLNNHEGEVEYNIIDLIDSNVKYSIDGKIVNRYGKNSINVASICYKNKNKNYIINTSNLVGNSVSDINCFGIVKDESLLNYDVVSYIEKGAKKSVVKQSSSILLFDELSQGKNNPILLIEENDVKASHGSSIGKIDDETMFYLCSRGLSKIEATNLICLGKIQYLIDKIDDKEIKELLVNNFKERMR